MIQTFPISGMTCQHCVSRVHALLSSVAGVDHVTVDLIPPRARIEGQSLDVDILSTALADTQFTIGSTTESQKTAHP